MALLDEGMNWAVIVLAQRFGLTQKAETAFRRPVKIGEPHTIACWVEEGSNEQGRTGIGEIRNAEGKVCVRMTATYYVMTKEQAEAAIGASSEQAGSFTRS